MKYLITVSYDGSKYYGFQRLNDLPSIQKELEDALSVINKDRVEVKGSGRTDRGVHALGQRCHFEIKYDIPCDRLINAINSLLSNYVRVIDCVKVDDNFHARFNVKRKKYKYIINMGKYDVIKEDYLYNYCKKLDIKSMKSASKYLIGKHSYKVFVSGERDNYNSEIFNINFNRNKDILTIEFIGKSFYRYMVRNMVGALILVGCGKISIEEFKNMIDNENKEYSYLTVPANGLYLESVEY